MINDATSSNDAVHARSGTRDAVSDKTQAKGRFKFDCYRMINGVRELVWSEELQNTVTTEGKNALLDKGLSASGYTAAVYIGLISSVGYVSAPSVGDTMALHPNWKEAGTTNAPTFAARVAATFASASGGTKSTAANSSFTFTGAGTVKGAFICFNGATSVILNTTGSLYAGCLFEFDHPVAANYIIQVGYSTTLT